MSVNIGIGGKVYQLPDIMVAKLQAYVERGAEPGSFLLAVLRNDLQDAFARADSSNAELMRGWAGYVYNEIPGSCWGSADKVNAWLSAGGLEGMSREAA